MSSLRTGFIYYYTEGIPFVIFTYSLVMVTNKRTPNECYFNVFYFVIQFNIVIVGYKEISFVCFCVPFFFENQCETILLS